MGECKNYILERKEGDDYGSDSHAKSTVSHMKDIISGVLNKAMDDEIISANPIFRLGKYIKGKDRKEEINPFFIKF